MSDPIVVVDSSHIREGKLSAVKAVIEELVAFVDSTEPELIAYNIYLNEDGTRMTVVQIHPDSASMELHLSAAAPVFRKFADLLTLSGVDFYGEPSDTVLEQMREKAQMLGNARVAVNPLQAGFARFGASAP
jgi:hypothetical protein